MSNERELPSICPECGEILDQSQYINQTQSECGYVHITWNWLYDEVSCPKCHFYDSKLNSCTTK